jgi:hypothetical protein
LSDFLAACDNDTLNVNDAEGYPLMKNLLGGDLRTSLETFYKTFTATDKTNTNFQEYLRSFTRNILSPMSWILQKAYMDNVTKPNHMVCYETDGRLRLINNLSVFLPGSNDQFIMPNDVTLKEGYYNLMPSSWQSKFDSNGLRVDELTYTLENLIDFMEAQRLQSQGLAHRRIPRPHAVPFPPSRAPTSTNRTYIANYSHPRSNERPD